MRYGSDDSPCAIVHCGQGRVEREKVEAREISAPRLFRQLYVYK